MKTEPPTTTEAEARRVREAAALRENLRKRKAQQTERQERNVKNARAL